MLSGLQSSTHFSIHLRTCGLAAGVACKPKGAAESVRAVFEGMVVVVISGFLSVNRLLCVVVRHSHLATLAWQSLNDRFDGGARGRDCRKRLSESHAAGIERAHLSHSRRAGP